MQHGKQRQRRLFGIILILALLGNLFEMPAQQVYATESGAEASGNYVASGTCGTNVTWTLDEEGVLTISGSGIMDNFTSSAVVPWVDHKSCIKKAIIEDGVTRIGNYTFSGCSGMTNITLSEGVTSIGGSAFNGCSGLTSILLPEGLASIGAYAFYGCSGLTSLSLPGGVTSIGDFAFSGCSGLTSITIPEAISSIAYGLFRGCSGLVSLTLPDVLTSIGGQAFYGCSGLTSLSLPEGVTGIGGGAFSGCSGLTSLSLPEKVASIREDTFYGCSGLTSLTLSERVTSIGAYAFYGCSGLTGLSLPERVTSIGAYAFYGCSGLTSLSLPEKVTSIGNGAFSGCKGLTSILLPEGVTSIGDGAFTRCSGLTSLSLPEGVTSIGDRVFQGCSGLTSLTLPERVTSIGNYAFYGCSGLTSLSLPGGITSIGEYAFCNCSNLTNMTLPNGVTSIGNNAFFRCSGLINLTLPETMSSIGDYVFYGCSGLTSILLPEGLTSIGDSAFSWCSGLTSLTLPGGVSSIGAQAFYCSGLTSILLPEGVTSIGDSAFWGCDGLGAITLACHWNPEISTGDFYGAQNIRNVNFIHTGDEGYYVINNTVCYGCLNQCDGIESFIATLCMDPKDDLTYSGSAITPAVSMVYPDNWVGEKKQPVTSECIYSNNINAGVATCTWTYEEGVTVSVNYTISAAPTYIEHATARRNHETDGTIYSTTALSEVVLSGVAKNEKGETLEGTFTLADSVTELQVGTQEYSCVFVPANANYAMSEGMVRITVVQNEVTSITVDKYPDKLSYVQGDLFDLTGAIVMASYSDGTKMDVTNRIFVSDNTLVANQTAIELRYVYKEAGADINVVTTMINDIRVDYLETGFAILYNGTTKKEWYGNAENSVVISAEGYMISDTWDGNYDTEYEFVYGEEGVCESTLYFKNAKGQMTDGVMVSVKFDHTAPVLSKEKVSVTETTAKVEVSAAENGSGAECYFLVFGTSELSMVTKETISAYNGVITEREELFLLSDLEPGTLYYYAIAVADRSGNVSEVSKGSFTTEKVEIVFAEEAEPVVKGIYGEVLSDMNLSKTADISDNGVAGVWSITEANAEKIYPAVGENVAYGLTFTPENTVIYKSYTTTVIPQVERKPITISATATDRAYEPENKTVDVTVELIGVRKEDASVHLADGNLLQGTISDAKAGSYDRVRLPVLALEGMGAENYVLQQSSGEVNLSVPVTIAKLTPEIGEVTDYSITYGDTDFILCVADNNPEADVSYTSDNEAVATIENNTVIIKGAGEVNVTVSMEESRNYRAAENKVFHVTVKPASVTVCANSYTVKKGDSLPVFAFTSTGIFEGEALSQGIEVICEVPDTSLVGKHAITIVGPETEGNYTYVYVDGLLEVLAEDEAPIVRGDMLIMGWDAIKERIGVMSEGECITIEMNGAVIVPGDVIELLKSKGVVLILVMDNGIKWTVDGALVTADGLNAINFMVTPETEETPLDNVPEDIINEITGEVSILEVNLSHSGEFGFTAKMTINLGGENAGGYAGLFYYNPVAKMLEHMESVVIPPGGDVTFSFAHASDYLIVLDETDPNCAHEETEVRGFLLPSCTGNGYSGDVHCKICEKVLAEGTVTNQVGHSYSSIVTKQPTTTIKGIRTYTCIVCGNTYTEEIEKLPPLEISPTPSPTPTLIPSSRPNTTPSPEPTPSPSPTGEPTPSVTPIPDTTEQEPVLKSGYTVQIGAFVKRTNAEMWKKRGEELNIPMYIIETDTFLKVQTDVFTTREKAKKISELFTKAKLDNFILKTERWVLTDDDTTAGSNVPASDGLPDKKTIEMLAREVIDGKWGNGKKRKTLLIEAGYDYRTVQNRVNEILK